MSERRSREFWEKLSAEVDGGRSAEDVARRHHVKVGTLRWWRWQIGRQHKKPAKRKAPALVPVVVRASTPAPTGYVEMLAGGVVVRFAIGTDVEYVAQLASRLEGSC